MAKQVLTTETIDKFFDILHKALSYVELISKPRGKLVTNKHILKINAVITIILAFLFFPKLAIPRTLNFSKNILLFQKKGSTFVLR